MDRMRSLSALNVLSARRLSALLVSMFLLCAAVVVNGSRAAVAGEGIAFRGASSGANGEGPTLTLKTPAGVQRGDLMLAGLFERGSPAITPPIGWEYVRSDVHGHIYYRFASDSEPSSYTWSFSPAKPVVGVIAVYSGVNSPPVSASSGRRNNRSHRISAPTVYVGEPGSMVVGFFGMARRTTFTRPAGMTRRALRRSWSGPAVAIQVADFVKYEAGATGRRISWARVAAPNVGEMVVLSPVQPPPPPGDGLDLRALDSASVLLSWTAPPGTARIQVFRNGRLIDDFAKGYLSTYTDQLLWRNSTYSYKVRFLDSASRELSAPSGSVSTPSPSGPFPRLYADSSFWNQPIGSNPPIDSNSAAMVSKALARYAGSANFTNSDEWGYPIAYADANSKLYAVGCFKYDCDRQVSVRIPRYARPNTSSDGHLVVVDESARNEVDMWIGSYDSGKDSWTAGSRYRTDPEGWGAMCYERQRCNGAVAAGFAEPGGVVRPEEIEQGHIDHALVIATPYTRSGFIACPATHTDGKYADSAALPEGARIQLDPNFNVNAQSWPAWQKVVARALQTYGAYVADTSGSLEVRAEANLNRGYDAWAKLGISHNSPSMSFLPWAKFRVLKLVAC